MGRSQRPAPGSANTAYPRSWVWEFPFRSDRLCLDFISTLGSRRSLELERLRAPSDLQRWVRQAGIGELQTASKSGLGRALELRDAVYTLVTGNAQQQPSAIATLNHAALHPAGRATRGTRTQVEMAAHRRRRPSTVDHRSRRDRSPVGAASNPRQRVRRSRLHNPLSRHLPPRHAPLVRDGSLRKPGQERKPPRQAQSRPRHASPPIHLSASSSTLESCSPTATSISIAPA